MKIYRWLTALSCVAFIAARGQDIRFAEGRSANEIETIDGKPAAELGLSALRERLRQDGQDLKLELKRGDDRLMVAMKTRRMI